MTWTPPIRFECLNEPKWVTADICRECKEECRKRTKENQS